MLRGCVVLAILLIAGFASAVGPQSPAPHGVVLYSPTKPAGSTFGWAVVTLDVNGDGYGDAAVSDRTDDAGAVFIFLGGPSGFATTPAFTIRGERTRDQFGDGMTSLGDIDNDHRDDLAVGAPYALGPAGEADTGRVYIFKASRLTAQTSASSASLILYGRSGQARLGSHLAGGMDATGDGVPDLLVGEPLDLGAVYLVSPVLTGASRIDAVATAWVTGETVADGIGSHGLTFVADITKDGRAEWAIGSPRYSTTDAGRVYMIVGQPRGGTVKAASYRYWDGVGAGDNFGFSLSFLKITSTQTRIVAGSYGADGSSLAGGRIYLIPPTALNGSASQRAFTTVKGFDSGAAGASVAIGDFNGDGASDLVMGAPLAQVNSASPGEVAFALAPFPTGVPDAVDIAARIYGDFNGGHFGHAVAVVAKPDAGHPAGLLVSAYKETMYPPRVHLLMNKPPVGIASLRDIKCTGPSSDALLNASLSTDPDGPNDIFSATWTRIDGGGGRVDVGSGITLPISIPVGKYQYELRVTDNYLASSPAVASFLNVTDSDPPTVKLSRPNNGIVYVEDQPVLDAGGIVPLVAWGTHVDNLTVRADASDLCSGIDRVEFWVENTLQYTARAPPYQWSYDPHQFWPAFKHIYARAYDLAGNGPTVACVHVVNSAWLDLHHLPVVGEGPPADFASTLVPTSPQTIVAGHPRCADDTTDALLDPVHPITIV